jgi:hypothetical protein
MIAWNHQDEYPERADFAHRLAIGGRMPMQVSDIDTSEAAILNRVIGPDKPTLSPESARDILALDFPEDDKRRMHQLSIKAQEGTLTTDEEEAITNYERVGHLINILQSKARRCLKGRRGTNGKTRSH